MSLILDKNYEELIKGLKERVRESSYRAITKVNTEMILTYHHIGTTILKAQKEHGWGTKIIDQLAKDLSSEFPNMKGFSSRSLKYMRKLAVEYYNNQFVQQAAAQLPWGHLMLLLDKLSSNFSREFYAQKTIENGWSRNVMLHHIESKLHEREGALISNFKSSLPLTKSDLVQKSFKDPYIFDFIKLSDKKDEREMEEKLCSEVKKFLLELGSGFSFVGRQYRLEVGGQDFYIDLLFYHLKLRCFVVIELKTGEFKPEYAGKMGFYLSAVDSMLKHEQDSPSIGIILCKGKNKVVAEYSLNNLLKPIGLASYKTKSELPKGVKDVLPEVTELEKILSY